MFKTKVGVIDEFGETDTQQRYIDILSGKVMRSEDWKQAKEKGDQSLNDVFYYKKVYTNSSTSFGERNHMWKADRVGYHGLHHWVARQKGKPQKCENCGDTSDRKYEWANLSHKYKRDVDDWARFCTPCHRAYDNGKLSVIRKRYHKFVTGNEEGWEDGTPAV